MCIILGLGLSGVNNVRVMMGLVVMMCIGMVLLFFISLVILMVSVFVVGLLLV